MNEVDLTESIPESYQERAGRLGIRKKNLRGDPPPSSHGLDDSFRKEIERVVQYHHKNVFPKILH
jgi:hypothetical protein